MYCAVNMHECLQEERRDAGVRGEICAHSRNFFSHVFANEMVQFDAF